MSQLHALLTDAAHTAATGRNATPEPTHAQKLAGNYRMGRFRLHGMDLVIENPEGTFRTGTDTDGQPWRTRLAAHYGYFAGTRGADGDPVDVFIGVVPESPHVWVVNQVNPDGSFDEHKVMLGFGTDDLARAGYLGSYSPGWQGLGSMVRITLAQLRWWLKSGDRTAPIRAAADLLSAPETRKESNMKPVQWDNTAQPVGQTIGRVLYDIRLDDVGDDLLTDPMTMDEALSDPDIECLLVLDALVVEAGMLKPKTDQILTVLKAAGKAVQPQQVEIGEPVRLKGTMQIPVIYGMSDGQTLTIWFHNPDTTPAKLAPMDVLVSARWVINKKDVTIAVAPENGKDLSPRDVARRIMALIEKNSAAFLRVNAKAGERAAQIEGLQGEIAGLEQTLDGLKVQIERAQEVKASAAAKAPKVVAAAPAPAPETAAPGVTLATFPAPEGVEFRVVTGPAGKHHAVLFDMDAEEAVEVRTFSGADSLAKATEYAKNEAAIANRIDAAAPAPVAPKPVDPPASVATDAGDMFGGELNAPKMGFTDFLKARRLQDAVEMLAGMKYEDARSTLMTAGFSITTPRIKTTARQIEEVQNQLVAAAKDGTDGFGLQKKRAAAKAAAQAWWDGAGDDLRMATLVAGGIPEATAARSASMKFHSLYTKEGQIVIAAALERERRHPAAAPAATAPVVPPVDAPAALKLLPPAVKRKVSHAIESLNDLQAQLTTARTGLDENPKIGGGGRYESEVWQKTGGVVSRANADIEHIRDLAKKNGNVAEIEALITELGGVPTVAPSQKAVDWLARQQPAPAPGPSPDEVRAAEDAAQASDAPAPGVPLDADEDDLSTPQGRYEAGLRAFQRGVPEGNRPRLIGVGDWIRGYEDGKSRSAEIGETPAADLFGDTQPEALTPEGAESKVKTAKGTEVLTGYSVIEAARLITSHDPSTGDANPAFPPELQPRDRGRDASIAWVRKTANDLDPDLLGKSRRADSGAPIIGPDGVVESGNGRTMAVVLAYQSGKADDYRAWLEDEATYFGLKPEKVKAMRHPVLVRIRTSKVDRAAFAIEANQSDTLAMTATEKAKSDARRMDDGMIALMTENGDLAASENVPFLSAFLRTLGEAEAAQYSTSDGKPTSTLIARVQAAIFAKAYADDRLLELTADVAKPEIANIVKALNHAAPEFIQAAAMDPEATSAATGKLTDAVEKSLNQKAVDALLGASNVIRQAKDAGQSVEEFVQQSGLFGDIDPDVAAMAVFIAKNNRSAKRMGEAFKAMASFIKGELQRRQTADMFGDGEPVDFKDIVAAANRELERMYGAGVETIGLFDRPADPAPAGPAPAGAIAAAPDPYSDWLDQVIAAVAKDRDISADEARSVVTAGPNAAKTDADMRRSFEAMYAPGAAAYAHFGADPTKGLKRTPQEPDPEPDFDPVAAVNAAYTFDKATDDFKAMLADSLDQADYSEFATAKGLDQAVKAAGGTVSWSLVVGAILDSVAEISDGWDLDDPSEYEGVFDSVGEGEPQGVIRKGAKILGRAVFGGDGKAMIYVGKAGADRVTINGQRAMWGEEPGTLVSALFTMATTPTEPKGKKVTKKQATEAADKLEFTVESFDGMTARELVNNADANRRRLADAVSAVESLKDGWPAGTAYPQGFIDMAAIWVRKIAEAEAMGDDMTLGAGDVKTMAMHAGVPESKWPDILANPKSTRISGGITIPSFRMGDVKSAISRAMAPEAAPEPASAAPTTAEGEDPEKLAFIANHIRRNRPWAGMRQRSGSDTASLAAKAEAAWAEYNSPEKKLIRMLQENGGKPWGAGDGPTTRVYFDMPVPSGPWFNGYYDLAKATWLTKGGGTPQADVLSEFLGMIGMAPAVPAPAAQDPDVEFLRSVIDKTAPDMLDPDLADKIEAVVTRRAGDAQIDDLAGKAIDAYVAVAMEATAGLK